MLSYFCPLEINTCCLLCVCAIDLLCIFTQDTYLLNVRLLKRFAMFAGRYTLARASHRNPAIYTERKSLAQYLFLEEDN